jgi:hypothetical protein
MKNNQYKDDKDSITLEPIPESVTCPKCGGEIGLWTGSILTICWFCGFHAFKKETIVN